VTFFQHFVNVELFTLVHQKGKLKCRNDKGKNWVQYVAYHPSCIEFDPENLDSICC
jgi:hypothetical protein